MSPYVGNITPQTKEKTIKISFGRFLREYVFMLIVVNNGFKYTLFFYFVSCGVRDKIKE
jgi:hypothetical protein